jgi:hypothetical protein
LVRYRPTGSFRYHSNTHSSCWDDTVKGFDAVHDALSDVLEVSRDALAAPECLTLLVCLDARFGDCRRPVTR